MRFTIDKHYNFCVFKKKSDLLIQIYFIDKIIGMARLTTDYADVIFVTSLVIDEKHANKLVDEKYTLGEVFVKFIMKYPGYGRGQEFCFILNLPSHLNSIVMNNFELNNEIKKKILTRQDDHLSSKYNFPQGIQCTRSITTNDLNELLILLKDNAYWQAHLTMARLMFLVENAECFMLSGYNNEIIGFARVVTDNHSFASLWDVVVSKPYRGKGVGKALMDQIFSDPLFKKIPAWIVFTDTAKKLYEKFGFMPASEKDETNIVCIVS